MRIVADREDRLDRLLADRMPDRSRSAVAHQIAAGNVLVNGSIEKASYKVRVQDIIQIDWQDPPVSLDPIKMSLDIVFEDDHLIVVNKSAGLAVHPSPSSRQPTLANALKAHSDSLSTAGGEFRPGIVHRLDKDTSGLLLVAKNDRVHRALQAGIQTKRVRRIYWVWVSGRPAQTEFTIRSHLGRHPKHRQRQAVVSESASDARLAVTHCRLLSTEPHTKLECELETGRTHQIRVHLASVGLPVLGDSVYGKNHPHVARQALHARRLVFTHPVTGASCDFEGSLPNDLQQLEVSK